MSKTSVADVQKQVDEVTEVMKDNIDVALSNQEKASELVDKSDQLADDAQAFKKQSTSLKRTMWWQDKKLLFIIIGIIVAILVLIAIIIAIVVSSKK